jgi:hypothetical protein
VAHEKAASPAAHKERGAAKRVTKAPAVHVKSAAKKSRGHK